ncbi:MAG: hypothetical protein MJ240_00530 [Kiritimatiellae bacterium]|nr:hypothetical protein [Kiritimatiellia bacterium]
MKRQKRPRCLTALVICLSAAVWGQVLLDPVDNLRADYRNEVHAYTNALTKVGVTLGPGSGRHAKTAAAAALATFESTVGVPMTVQPANIMLGEKLTPPTDWNGESPIITGGTGGKLVWIDYAKTVIAIGAGPVEISWPLTNGSTEQTAGVVSASPSKRPVRLYWTHERPAAVDKSYRLLQNAGPTVTFGSNYRVTLYETGAGGITVWNEAKGVVGDVRLNGNELQAFHGANGTFLIAYSRLDEATGQEVLLAYELVSVLEPMQTQLNVKIGQQLRPISRSFDTNELYPTVTRGLTDESENGEIYVYQHGIGKQKNYIWAIRDSSKDPWKIEVFWRAKEELDIVWPFEVDIYAASWDTENAQVYLRDTETAEGGTAPAEPMVYMPTAMKVTPMDYQIPKAHILSSEKGFFSNYADDNTFALLKYTAGETVWFQTVRSVPAKNTKLLASLGMDLAGVCTNRLWWTGAADELPPDPAVVTNAVLAEEIRAPFAGEDGFFYPGWIKHAKEATARFPVKNPYNAGLYTYPASYTLTNSVYAPIFPVNIGQIEVWWQLPCRLSEEQVPETGHVGPLTSPIFFPSCPCTYTVVPPEECYEWDNGVPQIVIASGKGSAGLALSDYDPYVASPSLLFEENWGAPLENGRVVASLSQTAVKSDTVSDFTVEARFAVDEWDYPILNACVPWTAFCKRGVAEPYLEIGFDLLGNLYLNDERQTEFTAWPVPLYANRSEDCPKQEFHLAVAHGTDGKWRYYVNGMRVAEFVTTNDLPKSVTLNGGEVRLFRPNHFAAQFGNPLSFTGHMVNFRVWSTERSWESIHNHRYEELGDDANIVVQFGEQQPLPGHEDDVQWEVTTRLEDSSIYGNHGQFLFDPHVNGALVKAGLFCGAPLKPRKGLVLDSSARIYRQGNRELPGFNPNEEHALMINGVVHALRCDLNITSVTNLTETKGQFTSLPYVLVEYADPDRIGKVGMAAFRVVPENDLYRFRGFHVAGNMFQTPNPIASLQPANLIDFISGPCVEGKETCFRDRKDWFWAQQAGDDGNVTNYVFEFSYTHQPTFDYPDTMTPPAASEKIKWLEWYTQRDDGYLGAPSDYPKRATNDTEGINYTFITRWPDNVPELFVNQTLYKAMNGLPAMREQLSVGIVYEQSQRRKKQPSVQLIDPTVRQGGSLKDIPDEIEWWEDTRTAKRHFANLPPFLQDRFVFNPHAVYDLAHNRTEELEITGTFIDKAGIDPYLWLNVLDKRAKELVKDDDAFPGGKNADWQKGVDSVPGTVVAITDENKAHDSLALTTTGRGSGYVTLVVNNATDVEICPKSENVLMYVLKVVPELYNGTIDPIESANVLDKKINMKYTADFNGTPELWEFEWMYADPLPNGGAPALPQNNPTAWKRFASQIKEGTTVQDWITVGDEGVFGLQDHYITCRYRALDSNVVEVVSTNWSNWSSAQLAEGWIKRVLKAVNPFEQRCREYAQIAQNQGLNTQLSMLQQAGAPYDGDIPLNQNALDSYGLIQIYETVLNQAKKLSINDGDSHQAFGSLALALQLAAGRIAELYVALGNEALADAMNPTVDLGKDSPVADGAESSIFPFMNQCENLLDEELCLLRGRDLSYDYAYAAANKVEPWAAPYYNRLIWNFSSDIMGGQVAYVLNYGISDLKGDKNGMTDVSDAQILYPQGHGDAYGHYLSAVKGYYALLRHKNFGWPTQVESTLAYGGAALITCSYMHEKRFAIAAAQKARTAEMIVSRTARAKYEQGALDPWLGAEDAQLDEVVYDDHTKDRRHWGVDEWATRGHLGAYYDWLAVNAVLPVTNAVDTGILQMVDRQSTLELGEIVGYAKSIQRNADSFDAGMNPLGLSDSAVPFDISPSEIDEGKTHFEQIYDRAVRATTVAHEIFSRVKGCANALRDQNEERDFETMISDEEAAIERELIEIYGRPYDEDIGPGKLYPQGYTGPDLYHYYYVETFDVDNSTTNAVRGRYMDFVVDDYQLITTNVTGTYEAEIDPAVTNGTGVLSDLLIGAAKLYDKGKNIIAAKVNPYLKYAGVKAEDYLTLPVTVIDTGADEFDGKVDYEFAVAAWSNNAHNASFFVGVDGYVPKPVSYTSQRVAEGSLQMALGGYQEKLAAIEEEQAKVKAVTVAVRAKIDELTSKDFESQMVFVKEAATNEVNNFYAAVQKNAETAMELIEKLKNIKSIITDSVVEALPRVTGLSFDLTSIARGAEYVLKAGLAESLDNQIAEQKEVVEKVKTATEKMQEELEKKYKEYQDNEDRKKAIAEIKEKASELTAAVSKLEAALNTANAQRMQYSQLLEKGRQLQNERARLRIAWASDLSLRRYRNMFYQILRNDELQRYNEAFEAAAKYTYLAAKAYDYETGLLQSDAKNAAGREFMSQIIRSRALGRFDAEGKLPLGGGSAGDPGLADVLYRMNENWQVLKGRLGFNNPQNELDGFSLRRELFRKNSDAEGDAAWKDLLQSYWVEDLKSHPAFTRLAQPFDPMQTKEPGFAIPFRTVIAARTGFFGNELQPGDSAFSSTYFATKIRGVGVWLEGEKGRMSNRPEVYLIPAGLDYMRVPVRSSSSESAEIRAWEVVDQVLPIPYPLSDAQWRSTDWSMMKDVFGNELCTQRRHPTIRASVAPTFDESGMSYNARLIGRSVWNDQWWLIIPAASLDSANETARANFVNTIKDIHLYLKTYSFSGN